MINKVIPIFEFEEKIISHSGENALTPKEISVFKKLNKKIKDIQKTGCDIISFEHLGQESIKLKASSYVGVLSIGNKTIQILPKMARTELNDVERSRQAIQNLLYMLAYTKKLQIKETDLAALRSAGDNFFEVLIYLFAKNLLGLIQNDISKEYVHREENLSFIKGKLQFTAHIKQNIVSRGRFYLEYDEFCEDSLLNQILKYTTNLLLKTSTNFNNLKLLRELDFLFSDISFKKITLEDFKRINLTRLNKSYEPILNLCKIFIGLSSLELSADKIKTFSFVFDMNVLFEEFIGEFIKKSFYQDYSSITLQHPVRSFVQEKYIGDELAARDLFKLRPDIVLCQTGLVPSTIVDTKYKILNNADKKEGVSQSDLYQMNAYAQKYNCQDIILLYPRLDGQLDKNIRFKVSETVNIHARTVDLCRDLKAEKEELKRELSNILNV